MKFGRQFPRHQVCEWVKHYVDYDAFKVRCKAASRANAVEDFDAIATSLDNELSKTSEFREHMSEKYLIQESTINDHYGVVSGFENIMPLENIAQFEIEDILASLTELRDGFRKLVWYSRVNSEALDRLVRKLGRSHERKPSPNTDHYRKLDALGLQSQNILKQVARVTRVVDTIKQRSNLARRGWPPVPFSLLEYSSREELPLALIKQASDSISNGNHESLARAIGGISEEIERSRLESSALLVNLLQFSALAGSPDCCDALLRHLSTRNTTTSIMPSLLRRLIILTGRNSTASGHLEPRETSIQSNGYGQYLQTLTHIVDRLSLWHRSALHRADEFGRLPLHYAARYGLESICQKLIQHAGEAHSRYSAASAAVFTPDYEGLTPLHLAVISNHSATARMMLQSCVETEASHARPQKVVFSELLTTLLASGSVDNVDLIAPCIGIKEEIVKGKTALHIAAQFGRMLAAELLLAHAREKTELDTVCQSTGRSALMFACIDGNATLVDHLCRAGANEHIRDVLGWTAKDHAAFRGHIKIAEKFISNESRSSQNAQIIPHKLQATMLKKPVRADLALIIVNLGSLTCTEQEPAVSFQSDAFASDIETAHEQGLRLVLRPLDACGPIQSIKLPVLADVTNEPAIFEAADPESVSLAFDVFLGAFRKQQEELIGSAIIQVGSIQPEVGKNRESLVRTHSVPILEKDTMRHLGAVTFSVLTITPFRHPEQSREKRPTQIQRDSCEGMRVVGHRGLGMNKHTERHLQIGENTIESFLSATRLGASWVECDVQLTKDDVPVIYHDFLASETGTDAPVHTLSLSQFLHMSSMQLTNDDVAASTRGRQYHHRSKRRTLSLSARENNDFEVDALNARFRNTLEFRLSGFKGNTRPKCVQQPLETLEGMLTKLPETITINFEIKYPMLFEAEDWEMDTYAFELNHFVDTILRVIYNFSNKRSIVFSSFSPEICIALVSKQSDYPVLFLNDAGNFPTGDTRASSLQEAIHFARAWGLAGIVMASEPFVLCPGLINYAKGFGLSVASYGSLNNEPDSAIAQAEAGLDTLICDKVHLIAQTLRALSV
ncbi:MAG: hypothetical protein Q9159_001989 [Coniocarpon cinnabarinum]